MIGTSCMYRSPDEQGKEHHPMTHYAYISSPGSGKYTRILTATQEVFSGMTWLIDIYRYKYKRCNNPAVFLAHFFNTLIWFAPCRSNSSARPFKNEPYARFKASLIRSTILFDTRP